MEEGGMAQMSSPRNRVQAEEHSPNTEVWPLLMPYFYDWYMKRKMGDWQSETFRWGPLLKSGTGRSASRYSLYFTDRTDSVREPQALIHTYIDVAPAHATPMEKVAQSITKEQKLSSTQYLKRIIPPLEVNKIATVPNQNHILLTHSDVPELYLWNMETQSTSNAKGDPAKVQPAIPDAILEGHKDDAPFALACSACGKWVASGGKDKQVLVWELDLDGQGTPRLNSFTTQREYGETKERRMHIEPYCVLGSHEDIVEGVVFNPNDSNLVASVGDDRALMIWDLRKHGDHRVACVRNAHKDDIHCVDWSKGGLIATGGKDKVVNTFDVRHLPRDNDEKPNALHRLEGHKDTVNCVAWHPNKDRNFLASGSKDGFVIVWSPNHKWRDTKSDPLDNVMLYHLNCTDEETTDEDKPVEEVQWNDADPWVIGTLSSNCVFQSFRIHEYLYEPYEKAVKDINELMGIV